MWIGMWIGTLEWVQFYRFNSDSVQFDSVSRLCPKRGHLLFCFLAQREIAVSCCCCCCCHCKPNCLESCNVTNGATKVSSALLRGIFETRAIDTKCGSLSFSVSQSQCLRFRVSKSETEVSRMQRLLFNRFHLQINCLGRSFATRFIYPHRLPILAPKTTRGLSTNIVSSLRAH